MVNELGVIDTATNKLIKVIKVGNAPRQVVLSGTNAFVSNEGGRPAQPGDYTNNSAGTNIVANKVTGAASTGTVSEVNLVTGKQTKSIPVGLEPSAEYLAKDGTLMVANSNNDSISLINTGTGAVVQTVNVNPLPGTTVGSNPNAITMPNSSTVLVSIGRDNALAVYGYSGPGCRSSTKACCPPTSTRSMRSTTRRSARSSSPTTRASAPAACPRRSTRDLARLRRRRPLPARTPTATPGRSPSSPCRPWRRWPVTPCRCSGTTTGSTCWPARHCRTARRRRWPFPARLGCPSTIKHVFLIVKENRTYDQDLGDIGKGNSDAAYAQFGKTITPNIHNLASSFGLFDNFYDQGTLSADGHNWLMQADANDYIEKEFGAFYRSYPAQGGDALAYQRDGFLWNAAQAAGQTVKAYGEYNNFINQPAGATWSQYYQDSQILEGKAKGPLPVPVSATKTYADIPSLNAIDDHAFPAFDLYIPDQYRTDIWQQSFSQFAKTGQVPNLNLIWMPDDHTAGIGTGAPNPVAEVADNDLAVGRIIDTISHSSIWKSSVVFVVEDDAQNGIDHVDGHRAPLLVASPYAKRGIVDNSYYTQLNVVKTIEQILGVAPMNQEDRAAWPMYSAFTNTPDVAPYDVVPNQIPLTQGLTASSRRPRPRPRSPRPRPRSSASPAPSGRSTRTGWSGAGMAGSSAPTPSRTSLTRPSSTGWTGIAPTAGRCPTRVTRRSWRRTRCQGTTCPPITWGISPRCSIE